MIALFNCSASAAAETEYILEKYFAADFFPEKQGEQGNNILREGGRGKGRRKEVNMEFITYVHDKWLTGLSF